MTDNTPVRITRGLANKADRFFNTNRQDFSRTPPRLDSPPPRRATCNDTIPAGEIGEVTMLGIGSVVKALNRTQLDAYGDVPIYWTAGDEVSRSNGDTPPRRGQWEILFVSPDQTGNETLPPGSSDTGCGCGDCVAGTENHNCADCGCINRQRGLVLPEFILPDGVTKWEIPITGVRYYDDCEWRSNTFNGPDCQEAGDPDEPVFDTYRLDIDYSLGIAKIHRIPVTEPAEEGGDEEEQPLCDEIYIEWCYSPECEKRCLCPWIFKLSDFRGIRSPKQCTLCVGTTLPTHNQCNNDFVLELGETVSIVFPAFPEVEEDYTITFPAANEGGVVPDEQELPQTVIGGGAAVPADVPVADCAGKTMHVPWFTNTEQYYYVKSDSSGPTCNRQGIQIDYGTCLEVEGDPQGKLQDITVYINSFLDNDGGSNGILRARWYLANVLISDIVCGQDIVLPFDEVYEANPVSGGGPCATDLSPAIDLLQAAEWPDLILRVCPYSAVATTSGKTGPCGDTPDPTCVTPCVAEVYLYGGPGVNEPTKAWRIKSRAGCDSDSCSCDGFYYSCVPLFTLNSDDASDHDVGYDKEIPCNSTPEIVVICDSVPASLTVTVGESSTVFNPPTPNTIGITCNGESVSMELTFGCDGVCPTLDYNISPGCSGSALLTGVVSIDPLDVTYVIHAGGCCSETITIHVTE